MCRMCISMSDVRLSNASPTLERVDARQLDSLRLPVRRSLFGSPDPEELRELFQASMQEEECRFRDTYNFDPVEDRPLSGRFEWEEWKDAPEFYRRAPHRRLSGGRRDPEETAEGRSTSTERSRKRPSDPSGHSCSSEPQSKSTRTGLDEDPDPDDRTSPEGQDSETRGSETPGSEAPEQ